MSRVVCVGLATEDTVFPVPRHPQPDDRVLADDVTVAGGGPAGTAAVALARLGVETLFVGAVGDDETGAFIRESLEREGVDVSELRVVPGARSPRSTILVGDGTRAIVAFRGDLPPLALGEQARELCRGAAWVHVDHTGYAVVDELRGAARVSIDGGNPIEDLDLRGVALYAPTETALRTQLGDARGALDAGAELVVVTRGERGSCAYTREGETIEAAAAPVDAVSTLGAGDVFHGALLACLVRGLPLPAALVRANACAAMSCRALDGRSAIPGWDELAA
ncbi:MAG TPA: PfkB family carbohydrate kinase [Gaiellaceae bacterium]|nr:PfkB family carbohydrate kinase [Gaiellaceae bacterium]